MKRILVISPTPSHPYNAGNRLRISTLLNELKKKQYEIHFLYTGNECCARHVISVPDYVAMSKAWNKFLYLPKAARLGTLASVFKMGDAYHIDMSDILDVDTGIWKYIPGSRIKNRLINLYVRIIRALSLMWAALKLFITGKAAGLITRLRARSWIDDRNVDRICHAEMADIVLDLHHQYHYDVVMAEYIIMSCALEKLGPEVTKIIDTHDVLAGRTEKYSQFGIKACSFSTDAEQECTALARANVVIAIQEGERDHFRQRCRHKRVVHLGHLVHVAKPENEQQQIDNLMYVGAANTANIYGLTAFINTVLPVIRQQLPRVKLIIAGSVARHIEKKLPGCEYIFEVEDLQAVYDRAHIVINPTPVGTGLKIKNIEALGYAKPLVTMAHGGEGLEDYLDAFITVNHLDECAAVIIDLFKNPRRCHELRQKAHEAAIDYNRHVLTAFNSIF